MFRLAVTVLLVLAGTSYGQTLQQVAVAQSNKVLIEAKITQNGGQVSGQPSLREKYCPPPENAQRNTAGTETCSVDVLSYSVAGNTAWADGNSRTQVTSTRVYHSWWNRAKVQTQINGYTATAASHSANLSLANFKVTGSSSQYQVKTQFRFRIKNPVNIGQLEAGDLFDYKVIYYCGPYNYLSVNWDASTKKWKITGALTNAQNQFTTINETITPSGTYLDKVYYGHRIVGNGSVFQHSVKLNWYTGQTWQSSYGINIEQSGTGQAIEDIDTNGVGYLTIHSYNAYP